ncbi:hypothetical protein TIFTF001_048533 [Ficus carica]|uniref:Uncharacterized protein n=1 Tax=Ficus carica TaxID=3494 RepID=A0AA87Z6J5_FICCA|nr:hypothetical protein TIFTF001_048526 [Ficus carica]GMN18738.1 hypothetical protein TIFTF001_048529 [Ficus carica]GMN18741.1 hypothetical protein TIFTF001_048530 [Ficus carica]GMN18749.1 hypothetical protein TIFTF001_048533 [Ficus carica]
MGEGEEGRKDNGEGGRRRREREEGAAREKGMGAGGRGIVVGQEGPNLAGNRRLERGLNLALRWHGGLINRGEGA